MRMVVSQAEIESQLCSAQTMHSVAYQTHRNGSLLPKLHKPGKELGVDELGASDEIKDSRGNLDGREGGLQRRKSEQLQL